MINFNKKYVLSREKLREKSTEQYQRESNLIFQNGGNITLLNCTTIISSLYLNWIRRFQTSVYLEKRHFSWRQNDNAILGQGLWLMGILVEWFHHVGYHRTSLPRRRFYGFVTRSFRLGWIPAALSGPVFFRAEKSLFGAERGLISQTAAGNRAYFRDARSNVCRVFCPTFWVLGDFAIMLKRFSYDLEKWFR